MKSPRQNGIERDEEYVNERRKRKREMKRGIEKECV